MLKVLPVIFVALLLSSCFDKGDCVINNTNLVKINLKKTGEAAFTVTFSSVEVEGTSIRLYTDGKATNTLQLPVNPNQTETTFILNYGQVSQRITFSYQNQSTIPSIDCGALVYQTDVAVANTTFPAESIRRINNQLLKNATVNFEIFF